MDLFAALRPVIERVSSTQHTDNLTARANFAYRTAEVGKPASDPLNSKTAAL